MSTGVWEIPLGTPFDSQLWQRSKEKNFVKKVTKCGFLNKNKLTLIIVICWERCIIRIVSHPREYKTYPSALEGGQLTERHVLYRVSYLRPMKTLRALCAACPNTFPKNNDATVTPLCRISCFDAALKYVFTPWKLLQAKKNMAKWGLTRNKPHWRGYTKVRRYSTREGPRFLGSWSDL